MSSHAPCTDASADRLQALRGELDRIDDALHDLLMRRAELVAQVAASGAKGRVPLRPGREAAILRRLLARNRAPLEPAALVRLWRELLAGSSAQQQRMVVAVADPALLPTARAHFGVLAELDVTPDPLATMQAGAATLALMPWPGRWWTALLDLADPPHIVARLPFWTPSHAGALPGALVLSVAAPDPSGADRSLIAKRSQSGEIDLADVEGFVAADALPPGARLLGAYATPLGDPT